MLNSEPWAEFWSPVPGYPSHEISDQGRVRSRRGMLSPYDDGQGYRKFDVGPAAANKSLKVHRLVAELFIPNFERKPQVNHIDGDKDNNAWTNLEWVTSQENIDHAWKTGLSKRSNSSSGLRGVTWHPSVGKWQARAHCLGKRHDLGRYDTIQEASDAIKNFKSP